jgi:hypothetical protein
MNNRWHEVKVTAFITDHGARKNEVVCPDGTTRIVLNDTLKFEQPKKFIPYPHIGGDDETLFRVYRDGHGQLYFKDHEGDWLYFEPDNPPRPDQVVQLHDDCYCRGGRGPIEVERLEHDIPLGDVILNKTWEQIVARSSGL